MLHDLESSKSLVVCDGIQLALESRRNIASHSRRRLLSQAAKRGTKPTLLLKSTL
jgi:hypothetical protein